MQILSSLSFTCINYLVMNIERFSYGKQLIKYFEPYLHLDYYRLGKENVLFLSNVKAKIKLGENFEDKIMSIYKRYLLLKNEYSHSHYIALHGQSLFFTIISDLIKQMEILKNPEKSYKSYKFFRLPSNESYESTADFFKRNPKPKERVLFDHYYMNKLLSVDLYDENVEEGESTLYFLKFNTNICAGPEGKCEMPEVKLVEFIEKVLIHYQVPSEKQKEIGDRLCAIAKKINTNEGPGNLYVICLPKNQVGETKPLLYLSKEGGYSLKLEGEETFSSLLESLQERDLPKLDRFIYRKEEKILRTNFPQGRIICSSMTPGEMKVFRLNNLSKELKAECKAEIKKIAKEMHQIRTPSVNSPINPQGS